MRRRLLEALAAHLGEARPTAAELDGAYGTEGGGDPRLARYLLRETPPNFLLY